EERVVVCQERALVAPRPRRRGGVERFLAQEGEVAEDDAQSSRGHVLADEAWLHGGGVDRAAGALVVLPDIERRGGVAAPEGATVRQLDWRRVTRRQECKRLGGPGDQDQGGHARAGAQH